MFPPRIRQLAIDIKAKSIQATDVPAYDRNQVQECLLDMWLTDRFPKSITIGEHFKGLL